MLDPFLMGAVVIFVGAVIYLLLVGFEIF